MDFNKLLSFLEDLNRNNSKEWMDQNRKRYLAIRDEYLDYLAEWNLKLRKLDRYYIATDPKKALNRINNNLLFHPDRPVYKDHFGASLGKTDSRIGFYFQIGIHESFIAGGIYNPTPKQLQSIREAIDYNGDRLKELTKNYNFTSYFGKLIDDKKLTTAPKGFSRNHKHIDLLRLKRFAVSRPLSREDILAPDFDKKIIYTYSKMAPLTQYLEEAISV